MSNVITGIHIATGLMSTAIEYMLAVQRWNAVMAAAQADGRDITDAELESFKEMANAAETRLQSAIDNLPDDAA